MKKTDEPEPTKKKRARTAPEAPPKIIKLGKQKLQRCRGEPSVSVCHICQTIFHYYKDEEVAIENTWRVVTLCPNEGCRTMVIVKLNVK